MSIIKTDRGANIVSSVIAAIGNDAEWTDYTDELVDHAMTLGDLTAVLGYLLEGGWVDEDTLVNALGHAIQAMAAESL